MPVRINATGHFGRGLLSALLGAAIVGGGPYAVTLHAAPFEPDGSMPSVLAASPNGSSSSGRTTVVDDGMIVHGWTGGPAGIVSDGSGQGMSEAVVDGVGPGGGMVVDPSCPVGGCPAECTGEAPGLAQFLKMCHDRSNACWVGRADGLLLWRDSPPARPLVVTGDGTGTVLLDSNALQSPATGGVRGSLLRVDGCSGDAWEIGYMFAGNFTAQRALPFQPTDPYAYALAEPGIYGSNASQAFSSGTASLLATLQGAEFNRYFAEGPNFRWLAGFRWLQWQERFTLTDTLDDGVNLVDDLYTTDCMNNLYGGQIGIDAHLFSLGWLRVDSLVKAGAYYNAAAQTSVYTTIDYIDPLNTGMAMVSVFQSPASCSFVGEVGLTGVIPICCNLDFRFGYLALWLTGLAQPTQQLSGQQLPVGGTPVGSLDANSGTLLQGLTLGLEGRW